MPRVTIIVPEKTPQPYRFQLDRNSVTLGRGSENDIAIDSASVSVKHAEMRRVPGGYELRDLGSTNGIKIHGVLLNVIQLRNDIPVNIGDVAFDFQLSEEELAVLELEKTEPTTPEDQIPIDTFERQLPPPTNSPEESKDPEIKAPEAKDPEAKGPATEDAEAEDLEPEPEEKSSSGGFGCAIILLFLVLAAAAFVAGIAFRFQQETGDSLIDSIKAKVAQTVAPAKQNPAPKPE